tara:strand:+ start:1883 stop:4009 length:2127 start_codon:yes stop_codon:yes gene_type:complete
MGAYENPTQAIDRESGMIIANAISRIGQQTSNYLQTYADARNKELEKAKKEEDARLATQEVNRDRIHANIQKAGGRSQSWFDLADNAINAKYKYEGLLQDAPDEREVKEDGTIVYSRKELHELINKEKAKIRTLTNGLTDINNWKASQGEKLLNTNTNEPGGIYTGSCSEGSSQFNKSICQDYERKMALMGTLTRDGKVVTDVEYEIREIEGIPSVWAKIEGKDAFNVSDVLAQDYAEAENIFKGDDNDGINFITKETGLFNKEEKLVDAYLENPFKEDIIDENTGEKLGVRYVRPVNTDAVLGRLIPEYEAHFLAMVNSVDNKQDYNDLMATYLAYSKDGGNLETVAEGVWKLTDEAKAKFVQQMVGVSLEDKIPGYEVISAEENEDGTITYINQLGEEETSDVNTKYSYRGKQTGEGFEDQTKEIYAKPNFSKPTDSTIQVYGQTVPGTYRDAYTDFQEFQNDPIGFMGNINGATLEKGKDGKLYLRDDEDNSLIGNKNGYDMNNPRQVDNLFDVLDDNDAGRIDYGSKEKDAVRRRQFFNIGKLKNAETQRAEANKTPVTEQEKLNIQQKENKQKINNSTEVLFKLAESQTPKPKPEKVKITTKKNANKELIKELNNIKGYGNHLKTQQFIREYNGDWSDENIKDFIQKLEKKTEAKKTPKDRQIETLDKIREKYKLGPNQAPTKEQITKFLEEQQSQWDNLKVN